jgi:GH15 family glucan-1,4-alpha-glucosidase
MRLPQYQPIEYYGLIGDMHSLALVGRDGSIDWFCFPFFDSPSVFARMLDAQKGGHFSIRPSSDEVARKQLYLPETNVLITRFFCKHGVGEVIDFMPVHAEPGLKERTIIRQVRVVRGEVRFRMECLPSFDYARVIHDSLVSHEGVRFSHEDYSCFLTSPCPLQEYRTGVVTEFDLAQGQESCFILKAVQGEVSGSPWMTPQEADSLFSETVSYWRSWISKSTYQGRWREMVDRSAFVLKLLTFQPTGAIIAAGTSSIPEEMGGIRNWDYRYAWLRDSAFTVYSFLRIGFVEEAENFMRFIENRCKELEDGETLFPMYGIDGRVTIEETELSHLQGYMGSKPVRIGTNSHHMKQNDIYGAVLDAVYLFNRYGVSISDEFWRHISRLVNWISEHWQDEDESIWEVRDNPRHYVYTKLMSWVALDRALKIAESRGFPADRDRWMIVRDEIFQDIMVKGWNDDISSFTQYYGSSNLDASLMLMPLTFFMSPNDPRILKMIENILKDPGDGGLVSNSLVYRYNPDDTTDGLPGEEGTFTMCTFWLVEVLAALGRSDPKYLEEGRMIFEKMLGFANHLGIYSEQIGSHGEALGNVPLSFTHLSLISAACNLDEALGGRRYAPKEKIE